MTTMHAADEVAKALHNRLVNDVGLLALLGDPVRAYDDVPNEPTFPYLTYGEIRTSDEGGDNVRLLRHTITLHIWSRYEGRAEVFDIINAVSISLEASALNLANGTAVITAIPYADVLRATDGITRHGLMRLQIYTQSIGGSL